MIRPLRDDDIPQLALLWRDLRPDAMHSELGLRHLIGSFPERAEAAHWVADEGGVVAWAFAHRRWWRASGNAYVWIGVLPRARGRGLGDGLWKLAEEHISTLGLERVNADVVGDRAGERFLERRGFTDVRTVVVSAVDPRSADLGEVEARRARAWRDGYRLASFADADLPALYRLDMAAGNDSPGEDAPRELSFQEWRCELLEHPDLTHEGSLVVTAGDEPVAYCALSIDQESRRGRNEGTGTARAHRGHGLATLAKLAQLRWAAEQEIERIITDNDDGNAPMLAVNRRLGYTPFVERRGYLKELRAGRAAEPARAGPAR
jgi:RimJ/RimL family protein N-acetyltransferase/ribosomal protein S18 acetylase RimI-like enzyme